MAFISIGSATDPGKRESNQDAALAVLAQDPNTRGVDASAEGGVGGASALLILADGMGGRANGQVASEIAKKTVYREMAHLLASRAELDSASLEASLDNALRQANAKIKEMSVKEAVADGMGTTCTAAIVTRGLICLAHVGDSRAYLLPGEGSAYDTGEGAIELLTEDHSVVAGEVRAGRLTEEEARRSKFRNVITRAVGVDNDVTPDVISRPILAGEVSHLIISSDGLHGSVGEDEIERLVRRYRRSPQDAADALVVAAKSAGASDNITVIVARIDATGDVTIPEELAAASTAAQDTKRPRPRRVSRAYLFGNALAFLIGIALTGAIGWLALPGGGSYMAIPRRPVASTSAPAPGQSPNPEAGAAMGAAKIGDLSAATYAAPQSLLGRAVAGNVLLRAQDDLLLVDPRARRILRVRTSDGQVQTSVPDSANLAATMPRSASYWAADSQGNLYESIAAPPSIRKYGADSRFLRTIAQGVLTAPAALAVAPSGDLFVIDNGALKRIQALPAAGPGNPTTRTPASQTRPTTASNPPASKF